MRARHLVLTYKIEEAGISKRKKVTMERKVYITNFEIQYIYLTGMGKGYIFKLVHTLEHVLNQPNFIYNFVI